MEHPETTPLGPTARRRAQREAAAKAKADMELADEQRAQAMAADGKITVEQARRIVKASKSPLGKFIAGAVIGGSIGTLVFLVGWCMKPRSEYQRLSDVCRLAAQLATEAGGNKNFWFAEAVSPTEATLNFRSNGRTWETTYICKQ